MKKAVIRKTVLLSFLLLLGNILSAQSNFRFGNEIDLPATDSWNFIKYGEVGASLYTGTINLSIPFYTYKDKDFEIPVSFDYASNGLSPNLKAGFLGPDWVLNAGGCITVDIRGIPDYGKDGHENRGFHYLNKSSINYQPDIYKLWRFANIADKNVETGMPSPEILYCTDGSAISTEPKYDAEPDIFHFNFMGYSGTFHLGYNNKIYVYNTNGNNKDFKIEIEEQGGYSSFASITITTADGYKYLFKTQTALSDNADAANDPYIGDMKRMVAWKLSKITAPNGRRVIFNYNKYSVMSYRPSTSFYTGMVYSLQMGDGNPVQDQGRSNEHVICEIYNDFSTISSIVIDYGPRIEFTYNELGQGNRDQFSSSRPSSVDDCYRLNKIAVIDPSDSKVLKKCNFLYINDNTGARINYLNSINISGEGNYIMSYYNWNNASRSFPGNGVFSVDHWEYYNGKNNYNSSSIPFLMVSTLNPVSEETITVNSRNPDASYAKTGMLEKIVYPTGGYSIFDYEAHDYSKAIKRLSVNSFQPELVNETGICGGLRIKSIQNYLSDNNTLDTKKFEYKDGTESSGVLLHMPRYQIAYDAQVASGLIGETNIRYYSSNILSYNHTHIEYGTVTEKRSDGSKTVYNFTNSKTSMQYKDAVSIAESIAERSPTHGAWSIDNQSLSAIVAPATSMQGERGKLIKKEIFKTLTDQTPLYSETNTYNSSKYLAYDLLPVYLVRKFGYIPVYVENYDLIKISVRQNYSNDYVVEEKNIKYNAKGQVSRISTKNSVGDSIITRYKYVTDLLPAEISSNSVEEAMLNNNIIGYPLSEETFLKKGTNPDVMISGKRYTYITPVSSKKSIIKISKIELYDNKNVTWYANVRYTQFDSQGNILESIDKNGITTSYVWGYNGLYLVAKANNLSLQDLKNSSSIFSSISTTPLPGGVGTSIQPGVRAAKPDAQITFYEYEPFVGMTKVTDPSGKVTEYQYNDSGKLKLIKDGSSILHSEYFYSPDNKLL